MQSLLFMSWFHVLRRRQRCFLLAHTTSLSGYPGLPPSSALCHPHWVLRSEDLSVVCRYCPVQPQNFLCQQRRASTPPLPDLGSQSSLHHSASLCLPVQACASFQAAVPRLNQRDLSADAVELSAVDRCGPGPCWPSEWPVGLSRCSL